MDKTIGGDIEAYAKAVGIYDKYVDESKPTVYFLGLIGEISELAGAVQKIDVFSKEPEESDQTVNKVKDEIGDVLWYWTALANDLKYNYKSMWEIVLRDVEHSNAVDGSEILKVVESGGRIVEHLKKSIRDDGGEITPERAIRIQEKMIETLDHLALFCKSIDVDIKDILQKNYDKLFARNEAGTLQGEGDGITKEERT